MIKRTTPELAEFIADLLGTPESVERSRLRRLREDDLISQAGHGRGAAGATEKDAALLLLVSATGIPPLHAAKMAKAIASCEFYVAEVDGERFKDDKRVESGFAKYAVDEIAAHISSGDWFPTIGIGSTPTVQLFDPEDNNIFALPQTKNTKSAMYHPSSDNMRALKDVFGPGSKMLQRMNYIDGYAIRDLGDWLKGVGEVVAVTDDEDAPF